MTDMTESREKGETVSPSDNPPDPPSSPPDPVPPEMRDKRNRWIEALRKKAGNVSEACRGFHISRNQVYLWRNDDPIFAEQWDEVDESLTDLAEAALVRNIIKGNPASIIFRLKTKGRDRGYIERQQIEHSGGMTFTDMTDEEIQSQIDKMLNRARLPGDDETANVNE